MKKKYILFVLAAGILWGMMGLYVRHLNSLKLYAMDVVMVRSIFTTVLLFFYLLLMDRKALKIKLKDIWVFIASGVFSIIFFNYCYFSTITKSSLAIAAVLLYTAPAIVMILSAIIFREKITKRKLLAIVLTFLGCMLVSGIMESTHKLDALVFLTGLGAGLGYALYSVFSRFALNRGYSSLTITFYTFLFAAVFSPFLGNLKGAGKIIFAAPANFFFVILYALACTIIPYLCYTFGLVGVSNGNASVIASIEPVTATVLGFFYHEALTVPVALGIILVLSGIVICRKEEPSS